MRTRGNADPVAGSNAPARKSNRPPVRSNPPPGRPTDDAIRNRAFEVYQGRQREGRQGNAESDWQQAERDLSGSNDEILD